MRDRLEEGATGGIVCSSSESLMNSDSNTTLDISGQNLHVSDFSLPFRWVTTSVLLG